jgi:2-alkyl-3-oxoalkanoate reductase
MRVFVAGATGALGQRLVPQLVAGGHEVTGLTRSPAKAESLRALGARPVVADALDSEAVGRAVAEAAPEAIVHQLTALSGELDMRHIDRFLAATNRLRTEGTDHLLAAGRAAGARRFVAQSYAGWPFARTGGPVKDEADPLDPDPPAALRETLDAIRHLEAAVTGIDWGEGLSTTQPRRPSPPWSAATPASTRSLTTSRRRCATGCPPWRPPWAPRHRGACRAGWGGWRPARPRPP